ncbi:hypothetical protein [Alkalihalobacillus sp. BA299]|uniref:hypothetical protein n=1 Tax=Alkalihalobacillus sp. BA299 TaxID=2815938 RepID=UPI001ADA8269|nr:hypothetical protein [Alkalihalobacillus sp. BA299]
MIKDFPSTDSHILIKEFPFVHSSSAFELYDLLPYVDCVVTYESTVGLEAMLSNKSVFILDSELPSYVSYYNDLDDLVQKNPQKLAEMIINYFSNPNWARYVKEKRESFLSYAYFDKALSGERLKKLIDRLIS